MKLFRFLRRLDVHISRWSWTMDVFRARLLENLGVKTLIDIGANAGQYATLLREAGYRGQIVSCEPVAASFDRLARRCAKDPRWSCRNVAVGAQDTEITIHVPSDSRQSSILPLEGTPETVRMVTLDSLAGEIAGPLGVKADAQGYEAYILEGGPETLRRARFLELEIAFTPFLEGQASMVCLLERTNELGFLPVLVENVGPSGVTGRSTEMNMLFERRD